MMILNTRILRALVLATALLPTVWACRCRPPPEPKLAMGDSVAVFSGKVTALRTIKLGAPGAEGIPYLEATLTVTTVWKGDHQAKVALLTATDTAGCGSPFVLGQSYVIYAQEPVMAGDVRLSTNTCTRTREFAEAADDLRDLGAGAKPD
jgi:hypothetical protein